MKFMAIDDNELNRAKDVAYRFLSYRPRSEKEVIRRLKLKGFTKDTVEKVINTLEKYGYIDDAKFAFDWAKYRLQNKPIGKNRLIRELREKGIASDIIHDAVDETYENIDESEIARELAKKKIRSYKGLGDRIIQRRLFAFLLRRGFSIETSKRAINEVLGL